MVTNFQGTSPVNAVQSNSSIISASTTNVNSLTKSFGSNISFSTKIVDIVKRPTSGQVYPRSI